LPIIVQAISPEESLDNIIAVLEHCDRVLSIEFKDISNLELEKLFAAMQEPFPRLTYMRLWSYGDVVLRDSFMDGSAPRLRFLELNGVPFPGLPKLLLSATHLVGLFLNRIPRSGYISPEAMVTALSALTSLESFILEFQFPRSYPGRATQRPPLLTRSVLSTPTYFHFKGDSEYLDDLVALIDTPLLSDLEITFFNQIVFDTPQLIQFICRTPRLKALDEGSVTFKGSAARVGLSSLTPGPGKLHVNISCRGLDWQVSSVEQVCTSCLPPLFTIEELYITEDISWRAHRQDNIENALWLELLHPFSAVKNLHLSEELALHIGPALQELVGGGATEVLPALQNIFLQGLLPSGRVQEGIRQFVATRQVTSPIAVSHWNR
jgi:hypothetical protein